MKQLKLSVCNENGSVLLISVVILMLLTLLGIFVITTSTIEIQIAVNDKWHKMAFYNADGGVEASKELLEQSIDERGFADNNVGGMGIYTSDFFLNQDIENNIPSDDNRDISIPINPTKDDPHTNILIGIGGNTGNTFLSTGNALQMSAGYEGKGKGAAGGGGHIVYDIRSRREGIKNARATIKGCWRHII